MEHLIWSLALLCVLHLHPSFLCLVQMFFSPVFFSIVTIVKAIK